MSKRSANNYLTKESQGLRNTIYNMKYTKINRIPKQSGGSCWFYAIMIFLIHSPEIQYIVKQNILRHIEYMSRDELRKFTRPLSTCSRFPTTVYSILRYMYHILKSQVEESKLIETSAIYTLFGNRKLFNSGILRGETSYYVSYILNHLGLDDYTGLQNNTARLNKLLGINIVYNNNVRALMAPVSTINSFILPKTILLFYNQNDKLVKSIKNYEKNASLILLTFIDKTNRNQKGEKHMITGIIDKDVKYIFDSNINFKIYVRDFTERVIISVLQNFYHREEEKIVSSVIIADSFIKK